MADAAPLPAQPARTSRRELIYWTLLFAVFGPLFGAVIPVIALAWSAVANMDAGWLGVAVVLLSAIPAAYIFGLVPGAVTGALGALLAARLQDRARTTLAAAAVGAALSALWAVLISGFSELDGWVLGWIALAGAVAAAACAWWAMAPQSKTPASEADAGV
ncbi:MAG: hypothetical protein ABW042_07030 [Phenylobacterium sp.]